MHGSQHFPGAGTVYENMPGAFASLAHEWNLTQALLHHPFKVSSNEAVDCLLYTSDAADD